MHPLEDPSWDIQFQCDNMNYREINIGLFWARPIPSVREFFRRSQERWNETQKWDQAIMNEVRWEVIAEGSLADPKSRILDLVDYKSTMLFDWENVYPNTHLIDKMNTEGVMVHYTMIFGLRKIIVAKHFGHWLNETYYTQPIRLLQPINLAGTAAEIKEQIDFSVFLAKLSGRTFMWPILVNQTSENADTSKFIAISVVDVESVVNVVPWVEATYIENRRKYSPAELSRATIRVPRNLTDVEPVKLVIEDCLLSVSSVLDVDFGA